VVSIGLNTVELQSKNIDGLVAASAMMAPWIWTQLQQDVVRNPGMISDETICGV
jgi:hypothetical protein